MGNRVRIGVQRPFQASSQVYPTNLCARRPWTLANSPIPFASATVAQECTFSADFKQLDVHISLSELSRCTAFPVPEPPLERGR